MGALVLPTLALVVIIAVICAWVAVARYDKAHPSPEEQDAAEAAKAASRKALPPRRR